MRFIEQHKLFNEIVESEERDNHLNYQISSKYDDRVQSQETKSLLRDAMFIDDVLEQVEINGVYFETIMFDQLVNDYRDDTVDYTVYAYPNGFDNDYDYDLVEKAATIDDVRQTYQSLLKRLSKKSK